MILPIIIYLKKVSTHGGYPEDFRNLSKLYEKGVIMKPEQKNNCNFE